MKQIIKNPTKTWWEKRNIGNKIRNFNNYHLFLEYSRTVTSKIVIRVKFPPHEIHNIDITYNLDGEMYVHHIWSNQYDRVVSTLLLFQCPCVSKSWHIYDSLMFSWYFVNFKFNKWFKLIWVHLFHHNLSITFLFILLITVDMSQYSFTTSWQELFQHVSKYLVN